MATEKTLNSEKKKTLNKWSCNVWILHVATVTQPETFHIWQKFITHNANKLHLKVVGMLIYSIRLLWGVFPVQQHAYFTICRLRTFRSDSYIVFLHFLLFLPLIPSFSLLQSKPCFDCKHSGTDFVFFILLYQSSGFVMCASPGVPARFEGGVWNAYKHLDSWQIWMDVFWFFREEACISAESPGNMVMIASSLDLLDARVLFLYALRLLAFSLSHNNFFFYFNKHYELTNWLSPSDFLSWYQKLDSAEADTFSAQPRAKVITRAVQDCDLILQGPRFDGSEQWWSVVWWHCPFHFFPCIVF